MAKETNPVDPRQKVKIKLHKGKNDPKRLYVSVNNESFSIERGVEVEVPFFIAEVLRNSAEQDENTARLIEQLGESSDF